MNWLRTGSFALGIIFVGGCQTAQEEFKVSSETVKPDGKLTWVGKPTVLVGSERIHVGMKIPDALVTNLKMERMKLTTPGHVKVIITIPSIDTPVCDRQTHLLGETKLLDPTVERLAISADLPYAQRRFVDESKLRNIDFYSDYRESQFAHSSGLSIERNGLLARSVIVVDRDGIIRHLQIVPEIAQLPDMDAAFAVANSLAKGDTVAK
jgi:thiol peroxidase